jgi:hypothetical protein
MERQREERHIGETERGDRESKRDIMDRKREERERERKRDIMERKREERESNRDLMEGKKDIM